MLFNSAFTDWTPPHAEHQVTNTAGSVQPVDNHATLPNDVNDFVFTKYVDVFFSKVRVFQHLML